MATFTAWLRDYTGLSLYDFRALDMAGTAEKELRDLFRAWIEDRRPVPQLISDAIEAAADYGFDVTEAF